MFPVSDNGFLRNILSYELTPLRAAIISEEFMTLTHRELKEQISEYRYLWLAIRNRDVLDKLERVFPGRTYEQHALYEIVKRESEVVLEPIK